MWWSAPWSMKYLQQKKHYFEGKPNTLCSTWNDPDLKWRNIQIWYRFIKWTHSMVVSSICWVCWACGTAILKTIHSIFFLCACWNNERRCRSTYLQFIMYCVTSIRIGFQLSIYLIVNKTMYRILYSNQMNDGRVYSIYCKYMVYISVERKRFYRTILQSMSLICELILKNYDCNGRFYWPM